jgi:hypothetical protein
MHCCISSKRNLSLLTATLLAGVFFLAASTSPTAADNSEKVLRHVVLFQFKATSSPADVQRVIDEFRGLPAKIPEIATFEYGTDNSPEGLADGFTHCFLLTFKSAKDRDIYLPHADHKAFGTMLRPHLEKVLVVDYWAEK